MGGEGAEKPDQWNEEDGKELEKEEEKMKKKEKGLLAYLLKFFASLGGKFSILGLVMLPIGEGFGINQPDHYQSTVNLTVIRPFHSASPLHRWGR